VSGRKLGVYAVNVKIVKPGSSTVDPGNLVSGVDVSLKHQLGIGGGSTVTLVREDSDALLVDTGYEYESDFSPENDETNWRRLEAQLSLQRVAARDVTRVFITHFHRDHFGGLDHFEHARWYCHAIARDRLPAPLKERFLPVEDGGEVMRNTHVLHTPGHTEGHASILWTDEAGLVRVGICGDAILSLAWLMSGYTWKFNADFHDLEAARASATTLLASADLLIPGHGQPFFARTVTPGGRGEGAAQPAGG
jgi:glyoxylase-like metal-dependent hydrolase (beta-lactamase superfamily II)